MISELLNVNLVEELGINKLPKEKQEQMISQMTDVIQDRLNTRLLSMLSEDDKKELDKVLDSDGDLMAFYRSKVPAIDLVQAEVIADFKKDMLDLNAVAREEIEKQQGESSAS